MKNDTIAAIGTPAGVGGIAVVRISGDDALTVAMKHLSAATLPPRRATYCHFDKLDDVVATYFPRGYSGEPTVEIACHGSLYIQQTLLQTLCDSGARMAEPGEFTMRAFMAGRMNLAQAEAVADLIDATTPAEHRLAVSQLRGSYAIELKELRQQLMDLTSLMELELDFSQEDVEFADRGALRTTTALLRDKIGRLLDTFAMGNAIKHGIPVAIVGHPNVGKSSLLNALLGDERAIVSPVAGTTRDTVEETLNIGSLTFRIIDTAGLRHSDDPVEVLGIGRSNRAISEAMLVLHVVDATDTHTPHIDSLEGKTVITVVNKCDLKPDWSKHCDGTAVVAVSAKTGEGIDRLREAMLTRMGNIDTSGAMLSNVRHRDTLRLVERALANVDTGLANDTPSDLLAVDLRDALYHLGTITGDVTSEDLLTNIFGRFCIGK